VRGAVERCAFYRILSATGRKLCVDRMADLRCVLPIDKISRRAIIVPAAAAPKRALAVSPRSI
jgi:hypothetical protein